jgi:hypothetical protein
MTVRHPSGERGTSAHCDGEKYEFKKGWLKDRMRKTVSDILKPSVLTWIAVFVWIIISRLASDPVHFTTFIGYTVAVYGLSKLPDKNPPASGTAA